MNRLSTGLFACSLCGCSLLYESPGAGDAGDAGAAADADGASLDAPRDSRTSDGSTGPAPSFTIDHEENNTSEYGSVMGTAVTVDAVAALQGTAYGLKCEVVDGVESYGIRTYPATGHNYQYRFSLDPSSVTMTNGDIFRILQVQSGTSVRSYVALLRFEGQFKVSAFVAADSGENLGVGPVDLSPGENTLTVRVRGSSQSTSDGTLSLTVNDLEMETGGIELFDIAPPDRILVGTVMGVDSGTSGFLYLDQIVYWD